MLQIQCIYCGKHADTRDHVPPKFLLERPLPRNLLRTVPSCRKCNHGASLDEQYLLVLLGQVSLSPAIAAKLAPDGAIDRTLVRSPALEERLLQAIEIDDETGMPFIRPETERVNRVVKKIALGLFALRYGRIPPTEQIGPVSLYSYVPHDARPMPYFAATFTERFKSKTWHTVQAGMFSYIFVRDPMHSGRIWCIMDIHAAFWGIVHFPNPRAGKATGSSLVECQ